jgi:hypothetical protein
VFRNNEGGNRGNIRRGQTGEKLTGAKSVLGDRLPELPRFQSH